MLADECPNAECYGVPLVRPPKPGGGKDPRKECFICGSVYVDEENLGDLDHSIIQPRASATGVDKDKDVQSLDISNPIKLKNNFTSRAAAIHLTNATSTNLPPTRGDSRPQGSPSADSFTQGPDTRDLPGTSAMLALESAERALQAGLQALTDRLNLSVASGATLDPRFVGDLAEAIQKVTTALISVRMARQSERPIV